MIASEIIRQVEYRGCQLEVIKGHLKITQGKKLEPSLVDWMKDNKPEVVAVLQQDEKAREIGLQIGISGTIYSYSVSRRSIAYMEFYNDKWIAWRETYQDGKQTATGHKVIAKGEFDSVLRKFDNYIKYVSGKEVRQVMRETGVKHA